MTCGLGIVEAKKVLLAADSAAASLKNQSGDLQPEDGQGVPDRILCIVYTTSYRLGQILQYETELPEPPEHDLERFMATAFVDSIRRSLAAAGFERGLGEHGSILVGVSGQLFAIGNEFQVGSEATPYAAVGAGRYVAYGALYALEGSGKPAKERAEIALRAAQKFCPVVREPFVFVQV